MLSSSVLVSPVQRERVSLDMHSWFDRQCTAQNEKNMHRLLMKAVEMHNEQSCQKIIACVCLCQCVLPV